VSTEPVTVWVIRLWEEQAPEGEEPLEWLLLTSVPTTALEQAWSAWTGTGVAGVWRTITTASKVAVALKNGNCKRLTP
jgi:hypothetical protein